MHPAVKRESTISRRKAIGKGGEFWGHGRSEKSFRKDTSKKTTGKERAGAGHSVKKTGHHF